MNRKYVHGYDKRETERLQHQATTLVELLHSDTSYPAGSKVLEVGCGTGAQTITLTTNSPDASIISMDISAGSLTIAKNRIEIAGSKNVNFHQGDLFNLGFKPESFDHVFVCFVLEHLAQPLEALSLLKDVLKVGGTITVIEGDHGSTYFYPPNEAAQLAIDCLIELQKQTGGNANIGRGLYPLLSEAEFLSVKVSPRMVYVDASKPWLIEGFTKNTFTAMVEGIREAAIREGLIDQETFDAGIKGLERTTQPDGVFCYTFFKAVAIKG